MRMEHLICLEKVWARHVKVIQTSFNLEDCMTLELGTKCNVWCLQDEVRALGRLPAMNVPEPFLRRHPFPGGRQTTCSLAFRSSSVPHHLLSNACTIWW